MRTAWSDAARTSLAALWIATAMPASGGTVVASEFYIERMGHYFVTAFAAEEALLQAGPAWGRTATQYRVHDAPGPGLVPVCRFFSASFAPLSSHFHTADVAECEIVKANPHWTFEGIAFYVQAASADGTCDSGYAPVYRLYNNSRTGGPNHRYSPFRSERAAWIARGWISEGAGAFGVAFCVPVTPDEGAARIGQLANSAWSLLWSGEFVSTIVTLQFGDVRPSFDPDVAFEVRDAGGLGRVRWDRYLARFVFTGPDVDPVRFVFDLAPDGRITGCVHEPSAATRIIFPPPPDEQVTYEPWLDLLGGRRD